MAFPDDDIEITVAAALGADLTADPGTWAFTDLTSRVIATPITHTRRAIVGANTKGSSSATGLTLLNDDGWLTPDLPTSPYWPNIDVGTPIRLAIRSRTTPYISDTFTRTVAAGGWGTTTTGQPWLVSAATYSVTGGAGRIALTAAGAISNNRILQTNTDMEVLYDASLAAVSTGASNVTGPILRGNAGNTTHLWPGLEFGVGGSVLWTVRGLVNNVTTVLAQTTIAGLTYSAGTVLRARVQLVGTRLRAKAWLAAGSEPAAWNIDVRITDPNLLVAGTHVGLRTWLVTGNTNTLPNPILVDNVSFSQPVMTRIEGFISDVRPSFRVLSDGSTRSVVQVDVGGVGTRLERQAADPWGPLRRSTQLSAIPPIEYFPLEDAAGSLSAASAFPNRTPMQVSGPAVFNFDTGVPEDNELATYGSTALCSLAAGARLSAIIPAPPTSTVWTVSASIQEATSFIGGFTEVRTLEWNTPGGTWTRWALICNTNGYVVRAYNDAALTSTDVITFSSGIFTPLVGFSVSATQSGGNINVTLYANANPYGTGSVAGTLTAVTRVAVNPDRVNTTASVSVAGIRFIVGHIMVHAAETTLSLPYYYDQARLVSADRAWSWEAAHRRVSRQCAEERVPCLILGDPGTTGVTFLGPQQPSTFVELVTAAVDGESGGLLWEAGFGYTMLPRTARYNQAVTLTADMSTYRFSAGTDPTDVLVPKLDARGANYWTVQRTNGGSSSAAAGDAYRKRRGTVSDKAELDVLSDADTQQHAPWRVHLNADGPRVNYPTFKLDLAANPGLVEAWLACDLGSRVQRTHQPTIAGLGTIDQVVDGFTETFAPRSADGGLRWEVSIDASPAAVWDVATYQVSLKDSASTTLAGNPDTTTTSWAVTTRDALDVWAPSGVPYDWTVDGEQVTVTAITAAAGAAPNLTQTATVVRSVNSVVRSHTAGTEVHLTNQAFYAL